MLCSSCVSTYWEEDTSYIPTEFGTTNIVKSVHVGQKAFLIKSDISNLKIPYHGQMISLGNYSSAGDVESIEAIGKMVVYSIAAYGSMGAYPTTIALIDALKSGEVERIVNKVNNGEKLSLEDFPIAARHMPTRSNK